MPVLMGPLIDWPLLLVTVKVVKYSAVACENKDLPVIAPGTDDSFSAAAGAAGPPVIVTGGEIIFFDRTPPAYYFLAAS